MNELFDTEYFNSRKWRGTKEPLDKVKEESEKTGLKFNIWKTKIMASSPISSCQIEGEKSGKVTDFIFLQTVTAAMKLRDTCSLEGKSMITLDSLLKKQRHPFADEGLYIQNYGFSSSHIQMWEFDQKEGWILKNWCFWTVVFKNTLESPLYCKEIKPVNPKGNKPWIFIGRTDAEAETPILWPPDVKSWLIEKTLILGKIEGQRRRG